MDSIFASLAKGAHFKKRKASALQPPNTSSKASQSHVNDQSMELRNDDEVNEFRNRLQIKVKGSNIASPSPSFSDMKISSDVKHVILQNIENSDWKEPTPIQMQTIPVMLQNRDVLASAPTGSGKTASFVIPILSKLAKPLKVGIRALVLAPTRELAEQIHREASRLCAGRRIQIGIVRKNAQTSSAMEGQVHHHNSQPPLHNCNPWIY
jgi:ATP-dependent RNA helicase DDX52/ROK1